jgi:hypothetical protein
LEAFVFELVYNGLLSRVLRPELPDAVKLIGENSPHAECGPGQKSALNAFVEPAEIVGFRGEYR